MQLEADPWQLGRSCIVLKSITVMRVWGHLAVMLDYSPYARNSHTQALSLPLTFFRIFNSFHSTLGPIQFPGLWVRGDLGSRLFADLRHCSLNEWAMPFPCTSGQMKQMKRNQGVSLEWTQWGHLCALTFSINLFWTLIWIWPHSLADIHPCSLITVDITLIERQYPVPWLPI